MIEVPQLSGKTVAVMGLGRSGLAAARALMASGAEVWAWDDLGDVRDKARAAGVPLVDLAACDWSRPAALVLSPGIPLSFPAPHPVVARARTAGAEVIGDVELLGRARPEARFVGVTGTNGKSTTTALIGHILDGGGIRVQSGANLGTPALALDPLSANETYVLEMSSYQLDLTFSVTFEVAVLLNISADHLERHGGIARYVESKRRIFRGQDARHTAVVGVDDAHTRRIFDQMKAGAAGRVIPVSGTRRITGGVFVLDGGLYDDTDGRASRTADLREAASLPGAHNWQNAAAAYVAARSVGLAPAAITAAIHSFPGLPHRQELIAVIDGVRYVNDSKATNADAAAKALSCYRDIYWIAGGRAKAGGLEGLMLPPGHVVHAFLIGEAAADFATALEARVPVTRCGDLAAAVAEAGDRARAQGRPGAVVLLSPAAASFDQFADFEARGDAFRALVAALPGARGSNPADRAAAASATPGRAP